MFDIKPLMLLDGIKNSVEDNYFCILGLFEKKILRNYISSLLNFGSAKIHPKLLKLSTKIAEIK